MSEIEPTGLGVTFGSHRINSSALIVDGYGLRLAVDRGHLLIIDGIGPHRRTRTLPRAQRTVRRIVILGHTGSITLDAIRWCADTGVALLQIDTDGQVLFTGTNPARTDARLVRAQAAAAGSDVGVVITRSLLGQKLAGQADVSRSLESHQVVELIEDLRAELAEATSLPRCRDLESQAANAYFSAWVDTVHAQFPKADAKKVPAAWYRFATRTSPLHRGGHSPRKASDPINALLNYGYALAEAECRLAALAVGLDPGVGIIHNDHKHRDSLALDLIEPLRPIVDHYVVEVLRFRHLRASELTETREGSCRLRPPLTHNITEQLLPQLNRTIGPIAEELAHTLANSSPGLVQLRTPLSRANTTKAQTRGARSANQRAPSRVQPRPTCRNCGVDLYGTARKLCPKCWPVARAEYMRQLGKARARPPGAPRPTTEELSGGWTFEDYQTRILPALASFSLGDLEKATGLSNATCSRVRRGLQVPNPRHWGALARLAGVMTADG